MPADLTSPRGTPGATQAMRPFAARRMLRELSVTLRSFKL